MVRIVLQLIGGDHMARYFFHIRDGWEIIPDEEGMDLPDHDRAVAEGYASARDLAMAAGLEGRSAAACAVEVSDEAGTVLRRIKIEANDRAA